MVEEVHYAKFKDYKQVCIVWGGTVLLLCLAGALRCRRVPCTNQAPEKRPGSFGRLILIKTKMLLKMQLPPRGLWASICGGLSLGDLLLVCAWLALVLWYLLDELQGKLAQLDEKLQGNPAISLDFVSIKRQKAAAKSMGTCTRVQLLLLLYPVQRSSLLAWLFGTHFSSVIKYHRWLGWGLVSTILVHGYLYSVVWLSQGTWISKGLQDASNAAGIAAACVACIIASTSTSCFRRWWYQAFWLVHVCSMPLFFVAVVIHDPGIAYHSLPGVLLYCLDRAFRTWQHHTNATHVSVAGGSLVVRGNIITMRTLWSAEEPHGLRAGQTVYLSCPAISLFGSHPFSIADVQPFPSSVAPHSSTRVHSSNIVKEAASARIQEGMAAPNWAPAKQQVKLRGGGSHDDDDDEVFDSSMLGDGKDASSRGPEVLIATLHMRVTGSWTRKLKQFALEHPAHPLRIQVEGPYDTEVSDALLSWGLRSYAFQNGCANLSGNGVSQRPQPLPGAPGVLTMVSGGIGITPLLGILGVLARQHNSTHASNTTPQPQPRKEADIELGQALGRKPEGDMREPPLVRSKANDHTVLKSRDKVRGHSDTDGCTEVDNPKYNSPGRTAVQAPEAAGHRAWCTLPHVYLVHCCRHLEELQLLDTQLLQAACRASSWLHLHIAYTGFELEHHAKGLPADKGMVVAEPSKPLPSFPSGKPPRLLYPSLGLHPLTHVAHAALTFLGAAVAGLLLPAVICTMLASANQKQPGELMWGIMVSVLMGLGAFLAPLLLLVCLEGNRRRRHAHRASSAGCCSCGLECCSCAGESCAWWWGWLFGQHKPPHKSPRSESGFAPLVQANLERDRAEKRSAREAGTLEASSLRVLPGYVLAWGDNPSNRIPLHRGRPPLASLLRCIQDQHSRSSNSPRNRDAGDVEMGEQGADQQQQQQQLAGAHGRDGYGGTRRSSLSQDTPLFTGMQPQAAERGAVLPSQTRARSSLFHSNGGGGAGDSIGEVGLPGSMLGDGFVEANMDAVPLLGQSNGEASVDPIPAKHGEADMCSGGTWGGTAAGQGRGSSSGGVSTLSSRAWGAELPQLGREGLQVWVGGPEALWQGACAACEGLNKEKSEGPWLHAVRVAHLH